MFRTTRKLMLFVATTQKVVTSFTTSAPILITITKRSFYKSYGIRKAETETVFPTTTTTTTILASSNSDNNNVDHIVGSDDGDDNNSNVVVVDPSHVWKSTKVANTFTDIRSTVPLAQEQLDLMIRIIHTFQKKEKLHWLDLGCGDGVLGRTLLQAFPTTSTGIMMDFSKPMLETAKQRLQEVQFDAAKTATINNNMTNNRVVLVQGDFSTSNWQQSIKDAVNQSNNNNDNKDISYPLSFDVIVSGFAIHHVSHNRKKELYQEIYDMLSPGGIFLNLEHVASPDDDDILEGIFEDAFIHSMYHKRYNQQRRENNNVDLDDTSKHSLMEDVTAAVRYDLSVDKDANIVELTETQCQWLREIGFLHVDCYFKYLLIALFGGVKPNN